jgi:hypothetical protein
MHFQAASLVAHCTAISTVPNQIVDYYFHLKLNYQIVGSLHQMDM